LLEECSSLWKELAGLRNEIVKLDERISLLSRERDYNEAQFRQLESAGLREGELAELEEEQKQLANAEEIKMGLSTVEELFTASSSSGEIMSLDASLKEAAKMLSKVGKYVPAVSELVERVESCRCELDDVLSEVSSINSRTDISESRLEEVESRMSLIYGLMKKHSCMDVEELIALRDRLSETLLDSTVLEERREELMKKSHKVEAALADAADRLHCSRANAAGSFSYSIAHSIHEMELPYAVFEVALNDVPVSSTGRDSVEFRFSSTGKNAVDVAQARTVLQVLRARTVRTVTRCSGISKSLLTMSSSHLLTAPSSRSLHGRRSRNFKIRWIRPTAISQRCRLLSLRFRTTTMSLRLCPCMRKVK
jgi:DNA repair protein RecN (Recombination protein N)